MIDRHTNYSKMVEAVTESTDILGNKLVVGDTVRSFDFALLIEEGRISGMDIDGHRVSYVKGTISEIGVPYPGQNCRAYKIVPKYRVLYVEGELKRIAPDNSEVVFAPLNGTKGQSGKLFGVVKVVELNPDANEFSGSLVNLFAKPE